eukprot:scaffold6986_cov109-Isochrysis_galbana.AAC.2
MEHTSAAHLTLEPEGLLMRGRWGMDASRMPASRVFLPIEVEPADARPASSASGPADTAPTDMSAQKRPRDPASGNMVSPSPMPIAPAMPPYQFVTTAFLSTDTGRASQSLAHHTTLMESQHFNTNCRKATNSLLEGGMYV